MTKCKITTATQLAENQKLKRPLVFTNGCFDILHRGHVDYLGHAADLGEVLVVGVNTDNSVHQQHKSPGRPVNCLDDRLAVLAALQSIDYLIPFDESTPLELIKVIKPDILVKGGDWAVNDIVGNDVVRGYHGEVISIPINYPRSTTAIIEKIKKLESGSC